MEFLADIFQQTRKLNTHYFLCRWPGADLFNRPNYISLYHFTNHSLDHTTTLETHSLFPISVTVLNTRSLRLTTYETTSRTHHDDCDNIFVLWSIMRVIQYTTRFMLFLRYPIPLDILK